MPTTSAASEQLSRARLRLVFMGTPPFAAHCLERQLSTRHETVAVVTRADKPRGRGMQLQASAAKEIALARGIEVLTPASAKDADLERRLRELAPDLCVVVAYGRLLPTALLELPRLGCINAHASLLPELRGAAPIERAILEGHTRTGVTIMRISERMDAGDTIAARALDIAARMNAGELRERLAEIAADLLVETIDTIARGEASFTPQNETRATYAPPLRRAESQLDWARSAVDVDRRVRAFAPQPGAFTHEGSRRLKVLAGHAGADPTGRPAGTVLSVAGNGVAIACGEGVYVIESVQPEGKRTMPAAAWARGIAGLEGRRLGADV